MGIFGQEVEMATTVRGSGSTARKRLEAFASRVNQAPVYATLLQQLAHQREPDRYPDPALVPSVPQEKLDPGARDILLVADIIRDLIQGLDRRDEAILQHAVIRAQEYLEDVVLVPQLRLDQGDLQVVYRDETKGREFFATSLLLEFLNYLQHYADEIKLGICQHCGKAFVKPKHGAQAIYCSRSCTQKAYRARRKEREVRSDGPEG